MLDIQKILMLIVQLIALVRLAAQQIPQAEEEFQSLYNIVMNILGSKRDPTAREWEEIDAEALRIHNLVQTIGKDKDHA